MEEIINNAHFAETNYKIFSPQQKKSNTVIILFLFAFTGCALAIHFYRKYQRAAEGSEELAKSGKKNR